MSVDGMEPAVDKRIERLPRILSELEKRIHGRGRGLRLEFNLLKFHAASPKISFLAYPTFEKDPHPPLQESVIVDLIGGKVRRDDYRGRENPPILHRKETFLPADHPGVLPGN
jgi:hypothetical protein